MASSNHRCSIECSASDILARYIINSAQYTQLQCGRNPRSVGPTAERISSIKRILIDYFQLLVHKLVLMLVGKTRQIGYYARKRDTHDKPTTVKCVGLYCSNPACCSNLMNLKFFLVQIKTAISAFFLSGSSICYLPK